MKAGTFLALDNRSKSKKKQFELDIQLLLKAKSSNFLWKPLGSLGLLCGQIEIIEVSL